MSLYLHLPQSQAKEPLRPQKTILGKNNRRGVLELIVTLKNAPEVTPQAWISKSENLGSNLDCLTYWLRDAVDFFLASLALVASFL